MKNKGGSRGSALEGAGALALWGKRSASGGAPPLAERCARSVFRRRLRL